MTYQKQICSKIKLIGDAIKFVAKHNFYNFLSIYLFSHKNHKIIATKSYNELQNIDAYT